MKLLMENWRSYMESIESHDIFERHEYITGVLGIPMPLDEAGPVQLSEDLKGQILQEHLIYEGFLDSLIAAAKDSAGKIKDLLLALTKILKDGRSLETFIDLLGKKVINPITKQFLKAFDKLKEVFVEKPDHAQFVEKISEMFQTLLQKFRAMTKSWKKAMVGCTLAVLLQFAYNKVEELIKGVISGKAVDEFMTFLKDQFVNFFGQDLLDKVVEKVTDFKSYLGWIGPVVGGLDFVAQTLAPVTARISAPLIAMSENPDNKIKKV
jgi:hypothetical protein